MGEVVMALTPAQMDAKLDEHFGFETADNVEGVLATLTDDVEHDIVGWPSGPVRGHDQVRPFYETLFSDLADGRVESRRRLYGENFMVDDSIWRGTAPGRPFGIEGGAGRSNSVCSTSSNSRNPAKSAARMSGSTSPRSGSSWRRADG
jgi:hypothetical protein